MPDYLHVTARELEQVDGSGRIDVHSEGYVVVGEAVVG